MKNMGVVVTSINKPTPEFLEILRMRSSKFDSIIVIGDVKSQSGWEVEGINFYSIESQNRLSFEFSKMASFNHYSRKNIGYLLQFERDANWIYETDDDNFPTASPFRERSINLKVEVFPRDEMWFNVYQPFLTQENTRSRPIWPRGLDLQSIYNQTPANGVHKELPCPIQQGLANGDPDVDAIYRLLYKGETDFRARQPIALDIDQWAPINSQSTWWNQEVFRLMYLPSTCSFRLTDIIRGYIALKVLFSIDRTVSYHSPIVRQVRNEHNLLTDFNDEFLLYTKANFIVETLRAITFSDQQPLSSKIEECYSGLVEIGVVSSEEMKFVSAWNNDCDKFHLE
jgi:hypothetical protein